jgi:hypothetical protein
VMGTPDSTHRIASLVMWGGGREEREMRNFPGNECRLYMLPVDPPPHTHRQLTMVTTKMHRP